MDKTTRFNDEVMRHLDAAYNLARWLAHDAHEAEDVVQEAVLRAFKFFDGFRGSDAKVWLLAIVRNTFYTQRASASAHGLTDEFDESVHGGIDDAALPEAVVARAADAECLLAAMQRLPPEFREVLILRELEECSYKEIAAITKVNIGTVMSRLARARDRLHRDLTDTTKEARNHAL
ncbi:sigma-70 family RNA polymerase sigma factor [Dokdonella soli]|uniref:Sigma-70 family RNA polymerase sigma factor n=1 Tax=Dokdonella soli TaxID=529810 RepID=A0ABP3TLN9_9GAMM